MIIRNAGVRITDVQSQKAVSATLQISRYCLTAALPSRLENVTYTSHGCKLNDVHLYKNEPQDSIIARTYYEIALAVWYQKCITISAFLMVWMSSDKKCTQQSRINYGSLNPNLNNS